MSSPSSSASALAAAGYGYGPVGEHELRARLHWITQKHALEHGRCTEHLEQAKTENYIAQTELAESKRMIAKLRGKQEPRLFFSFLFFFFSFFFCFFFSFLFVHCSLGQFVVISVVSRLSVGRVGCLRFVLIELFLVCVGLVWFGFGKKSNCMTRKCCCAPKRG